MLHHAQLATARLIPPPPPPPPPPRPPPCWPIDDLGQTCLCQHEDSLQDAFVALCSAPSAHGMDLMLKISVLLVLGCLGLLVALSVSMCILRLFYCHRSPSSDDLTAHLLEGAEDCDSTEATPVTMEPPRKRQRKWRLGSALARFVAPAPDIASKAPSAAYSIASAISLKNCETIKAYLPEESCEVATAAETAATAEKVCLAGRARARAGPAQADGGGECLRKTQTRRLPFGSHPQQMSTRGRGRPSEETVHM